MAILDDVLIHYGIKRRSGRYPWGSGENPYQGEDSSKRILFSKKSNGNHEQKRSDLTRSKYIQSLSMEDLQKNIDRLRKEKELKDLASSDVNKGKKIILDTLTDIGKQTAREVITGTTRYGIVVGLTGADPTKLNAADLAKIMYPAAAKILEDQK